jgi:hypothetical protein
MVIWKSRKRKEKKRRAEIITTVRSTIALMSRPQQAFERVGMLTKHSGPVTQSRDTDSLDNPSLPENSEEIAGLQELKGVSIRTQVLQYLHNRL